MSGICGETQKKRKLCWVWKGKVHIHSKRFTHLLYLFIFIFHFIFFLIFQWCSQDPRCRRLQLNDFLVAPMQHCTKLPLLLANIRKYTSSDYDKNILALTIGKVEISLRKLYVTCWFMSNTVMFFMDKTNMTKCIFIFKHTSIWVSKNAKTWTVLKPSLKIIWQFSELNNHL